MQSEKYPEIVPPDEQLDDISSNLKLVLYRQIQVRSQSASTNYKQKTLDTVLELCINTFTRSNYVFETVQV